MHCFVHTLLSMMLIGFLRSYFNLLKLSPQWNKKLSVVESHQGATIVVINVQGFTLSLGRGSGYIHVGLSLCDVTAASFFLSFSSFSFLSMIHYNWPIGTIIK